MKNKSMGRYIIYSMIGFIILAVGAILGKHTRDAQGIMQTLPYIFIGIGAGIFGQNLGTTFNIRAMRKAPQVVKKKEIEEKDERNITIGNKAKAKAFALMQVNWTVVLAFVAAYLFVVFSNIYFLSKYQKEM